jgi:hypothetical protein
MQTIIGLAGRKQSGKNTSYNCMKLWIPDAQEFAFADPLKEMCINILGLEYRQAYGSDADKNEQVSHLLFENFPVTVWEYADGQISTTLRLPPSDLGMLKDNTWAPPRFPRRATGPMTARQVLQFWGSEIFRKAYHNVWVDATLRKIRKSGCETAVITDCRFPNELEAIQQAGGKVIKLTRNVFPDDNHPSETAFDEGNFDQSLFDAILDNRVMDVSDQCESLYAILRRWGYVSQKSLGRIHV